METGGQYVNILCPLYSTELINFCLMDKTKPTIELINWTVGMKVVVY